MYIRCYAFTFLFRVSYNWFEFKSFLNVPVFFFKTQAMEYASQFFFR